MPSCEKCWSDAHRDPYNVAEEYGKLMDERENNPCTPEEQAGPDAGWCSTCGRKTLHQHVKDFCTVCGRQE